MDSKIKKIFLFAFILLVLLSSICYSQVRTSTILKDVDFEPLENNYYNFSATLLSIYIPESKQTLRDVIQTGKIDPSQIITEFKHSPLADAEIKVYSIDPYTKENNSLCSFRTNSSGSGFCIASLSSPTHLEINFVYEGDNTHLPTQSSLVLPARFTAPSFESLVDTSWIIIFLIIGIAIAALYASGRDPIAILDITTPKVKGIKPPKVQNLKFSGKGKIIAGIAAAGSALAEPAKRISWRRSVDPNVVSLVDTMKKYASKEDKKELNKLYKKDSVGASAKIAEKAVDIQAALIKRIKTVSNSLQSAQRAKKKLEKLKKKEGMLPAEEAKLRLREKEIDKKIAKYAEELKQYESDLKKLAPAVLISSVGLEDMDVEKLRDTVKTIDKGFVSSLIQFISDPKNAKINIEEIKDAALASSEYLNITNIEAQEKLNSVLQAKIELERLYISEAIKVLNGLAVNIDSLSPEERAKYKQILNILVREDVKLNSIKELYKNPEVIKTSVKEIGIDYYLGELQKELERIEKKKPQDYEVLKAAYQEIIESKTENEKLDKIAKLHIEKEPVKLQDSFLSEIANARNSLDSSLQRFLQDYENYKKGIKPTESPWKAVLDFGILSEKASEYLKRIEEAPYKADYPKLDRESAKAIFDMIAVTKDRELMFDILYHTSISPTVGSEAVEFAKQRIKFFKHKT